MVNEHKLREQICDIGRRVYNKGFSAGNEGNISVRLNDREVLCTPTFICKGLMKPEDLCVVDYAGNQLRGKRRRTSEILLHLTIYKARPDVQAVVHCHPPHATAFAVAGEPIPKCIHPEVEVFLGEVPTVRYETPGNQKFADTVLPYVHQCNTMVLANHGTVSFADELEKAYFWTEILDAYCRILLLAKQLGRVTYLTDPKTRELLELKSKFGLSDPRLELENCDLCANSIFREGYADAAPEPRAFRREHPDPSCRVPALGGHAAAAGDDLDRLVQTITDQVMAALARNNDRDGQAPAGEPEQSAGQPQRTPQFSR
jgi:L-fuculose-phosphate aldolase